MKRFALRLSPKNSRLARIAGCLAVCVIVPASFQNCQQSPSQAFRDGGGVETDAAPLLSSKPLGEFQREEMMAFQFAPDRREGKESQVVEVLWDYHHSAKARCREHEEPETRSFGLECPVPGGVDVDMTLILDDDTHELYSVRATVNP